MPASLDAYYKSFTYTTLPTGIEKIYRKSGEESVKVGIKLIKKEVLKSNLIKIASYIPVIAQIVYGILLARMIKETNFRHAGEDERAMFARIFISLSPIGFLLLISDIFSTFVIKPACSWNIKRNELINMKFNEEFDVLNS